jgi:hypothetical protein
LLKYRAYFLMEVLLKRLFLNSRDFTFPWNNIKKIIVYVKFENSTRPPTFSLIRYAWDLIFRDKRGLSVVNSVEKNC